MSELPLVERPNVREFSVSEIAAALKHTVEDAFPFVRVRGEVSNFKVHSSGHIYFDLKDDKASLNAVIWRLTVRRLRVKPEQGLEVVCTGRISTFPGSSRYQIIVDDVELAGLGALMAMLEARKKKLAAEGLFDAARKKKLPFLPQVIGVVTSPTGAVIRDIMHRLDARFPRRVILWPVAVQGDRAAHEIANAIRGFNALRPGSRVPRPDLLVVARGGGSLEDLMAFNEESVVRAVFESAIPVISAVGHETDTTLIDFAADVRAPTPTAAAEMAVPVRTELLAQTLELERRALQRFSRGIAERRSQLGQLARVLPRADQLFATPRQRLDYASERLGNALQRNVQVHRQGLVEASTLLRVVSITRRIAVERERLDRSREKLGNALRRNLHVHRQALLEASALLRPAPIAHHARLSRERLETLARRLARSQHARLSELKRHLESTLRMLESISYRSVLDRGFALVRGEDGALRKRGAEVQDGERLLLTFADGAREATAGGEMGPRSQSRPRSRSKTPGPGQGDLF